MRLVSSVAVFAVVTCISSGTFAQSAPAASPTSGATAICKDGTSTTEPKKRLACKDHDGIKDWKGTGLKGGASKHELVPSMAPNAADAPAEPGAATTPLKPKKE